MGNVLKISGELFRKTVMFKVKAVKTVDFQEVYRSPKNWGTQKKSIKLIVN